MIIDAICVTGCVNWREYWMNAVTSPSVICPDATRTPPMTQIATYCRLPTNIMIGIISPDRNCARRETSVKEALVDANAASTCGPRPKTLTSSCAVNASSICPLSVPVCAHWATYCPCERFMICPATSMTRGMASSATIVSCHETVSIMTTTPSTVQIDTSSCPADCCIDCPTLSMSFVTRESSSPRGREST